MRRGRYRCRDAVECWRERDVRVKHDEQTLIHRLGRPRIKTIEEVAVQLKLLLWRSINSTGVGNRVHTHKHTRTHARTHTNTHTHTHTPQSTTTVSTTTKIPRHRAHSDACGQRDNPGTFSRLQLPRLRGVGLLYTKGCAPHGCDTVSTHNCKASPPHAGLCANVEQGLWRLVLGYRM